MRRLLITGKCLVGLKMFGEKNLGKFTMCIGIEIIPRLFLSCFFIFTSFNKTPLILLVKVMLIRNCKSVKHD